MAIVFDNLYHKICKSEVDFVNNKTKIEMDVYSSAETREIEKLVKNQAMLFKQNIQNFLQQNMNSFIERVNLIENINMIEDKELFLLNHPDLKNMLTEIEQTQEEGLWLFDKILKENIDVSKLKYYSKWLNLGLTNELCNKIDYVGKFCIGVEGIQNNDLSSLYLLAKQKIISPITDC